MSIIENPQPLSHLFPVHRRSFLRSASRVAVAAVGLTLLAPAIDAQTVRSAAGNLQDVTAARDLFRADLGGGTTAGSNGSFGGLRREINWDGTPDGFSAPALLPADFFNVNSPRGAVFSTAGDGVMVSAKDPNPTTTAVEFGNINPIYAQLFAAFSAQRLFASIGDPVFQVHFLIPGTNAPALVSGFGAVFTDVDDPGSTIEFFDANGDTLGTFDVPPAVGDATFSFLGVTFPGAQVAYVEVTAGTIWLDAGGEPTGGDAVAVDDFLYGEPQARSGDACVTTPTALCLNENRFRVEVTFNSTGAGSGNARGFSLTPDSGVMSFFGADNLELLVKVLNGCPINSHYWVYGAAATNVGYDIKVTDTERNVVKNYVKAEGPAAPAINDSSAFATCP